MVIVRYASRVLFISIAIMFKISGREDHHGNNISDEFRLMVCRAVAHQPWNSSTAPMGRFCLGQVHITELTQVRFLPRYPPGRQLQCGRHWSDLHEREPV
jgi:hypothetical protein